MKHKEILVFQEKYKIRFKVSLVHRAYAEGTKHRICKIMSMAAIWLHVKGHAQAFWHVIHGMISLAACRARAQQKRAAHQQQAKVKGY